MPAATIPSVPQLSPHRLLRRAERLGHSPGAWTVAPSRAPVAAPAVQPAVRAGIQRLTVAGQHIYPTGRNGKALLEKVRLGLLTANLSPHGVRNKFLEVARGNGTFLSDETFVEAFVDAGRKEVVRVEQARQLEETTAKKEKRKAKSVRGWTRPLKMNRPAWPESYKRVVKTGQDIRHIVRNATLKAAIDGERNYQVTRNGELTAATVMGKVAEAMGAEAGAHSFESTMNIYKRAYLNLGNLFPGAGAINRAIGLTADRISKMGSDLLASDDFAEADKITDLFDDVVIMVDAISDQMERKAAKFKTSTSKTFLEDFDLFKENILFYLDSRGKELAKIASRRDEDFEELEETAMDTREDILVGVTEAEIGRELIDIGANFGFDLPDEALESDDMVTLIRTEIYLANYTPGKPGELAEVLSKFMQVKSQLKV